MKKPIGEYIKEVRLESGLSIAEFSRRINKTPQNVNDIFGRTSIDTDLLQNIGKVLKHNFFLHFIEGKSEEKNERKYKVVIQVEIDDPEAADKIIKMSIGNEGLKQLKK